MSHHEARVIRGTDRNQASLIPRAEDDFLLGHREWLFSLASRPFGADGAYLIGLSSCTGKNDYLLVPNRGRGIADVQRE